MAALVAIVALSAIPRFAALGRDSLWYDEVVPMRLAREPSPAAMVRLLDRIEATRAPLHPLVLMGWIRLFGPSESSGRALNAACGVLTVAVVFAIGRQIGGTATGLWAAVLAGCSPLLVEYSREVKMYGFFTMLTCLAWWNLLAFRRSTTAGRGAVHAVLIAAIIYTHPLGLFMAATLAVGSLADRGRSRLTLRGWLAIHAVAASMVLPWIGRYFDHPPEYVPGPVGLKFLLGMPIGFTGGNSRTLILFIGLIVAGLLPMRIRWLVPALRPATAWPVVLWLVMPPVMLFLYSRVGHPIFGPSRYNVYVAPAYALLVARGLSTLSRPAQIVVGACLLPFLLWNGISAVTDAPVKADWRAAAADLDRDAPEAAVVVISPSPGRNFEVEVARYYLGALRPVIAMSGSRIDEVIATLGPRPGRVFVSASLRDGEPQGKIPEDLKADGQGVRRRDYRGLRLFEVR